jgi:hypothetical protein
LKLCADESFNSFGASQPKSKNSALIFQVDVKIEKGAAFGLGGGPLAKFGNRNVSCVELKFVAVSDFDGGSPRGYQSVRDVAVAGALLGRESAEVAAEVGFSSHEQSLTIFN